MPSIKTILVTGGNGQLGRSFRSISSQHPEYQFNFTTRDEIDLSNPNSIKQYFQQKHYDLIINCAAYTAVDKAEKEQDLADAINHLAVKQLAEIAKKNHSLLIHISTDYVFDGTSYRPYIETDSINPQNIYGSSKLKGEQAIQAIKPNAIIIRTSWVYSEFGNNFVKTMLRLGTDRDQLNVIFDQIGSPTYAKDLAQCIVKIVNFYNQRPFPQETSEVPVYHFSNEGVCSWYDFAKVIFEQSNIPCSVDPIETKDYPTPAKRPHYSVLNKARIKQTFALSIPYWKDSLHSCTKILQINKTL
jgi:dTDP-4-dehydrorhamnose reductase